MIIPSGYAQVNVKMTGSALPLGAEWTFGVRNSTDLPASTIASRVISQGVTSSIKNLFATESTLASVVVKLGPNATGASAEVGWNLAGNLSSGAGNPSSSLLVSKITEMGGRHGKGRLFLPALPEAYILPGGAIDGALVVAAQTIVSGFLSGLAAQDIPMVLLHADATSPTNVSFLTVQARVSNQRRRNRK